MNDKQHEQNLRDLALIRENPGWALTAVQEWRRLAEQVRVLEENFKRNLREGTKDVRAERNALAERVRVLEKALTLACCDLAGTPVEAGRLTRGYLAAAATPEEEE